MFTAWFPALDPVGMGGDGDGVSSSTASCTGEGGETNALGAGADVGEEVGIGAGGVGEGSLGGDVVLTGDGVDSVYVGRITGAAFLSCNRAGEELRLWKDGTGGTSSEER